MRRCIAPAPAHRPTSAHPAPPRATHLPHSFPLEGGTGGIWKAVARLLPPERQRYGRRLTGIDKERQVATFDDGRQVRLPPGGACGW